MKPWQSRFAGRSTERRLKNKGKTKPVTPLGFLGLQGFRIVLNQDFIKIFKI